MHTTHKGFKGSLDTFLADFDPFTGETVYQDNTSRSAADNIDAFPYKFNYSWKDDVRLNYVALFEENGELYFG